jgi:hypothetical protein
LLLRERYGRSVEALQSESQQGQEQQDGTVDDEHHQGGEDIKVAKHAGSRDLQAQQRQLDDILPRMSISSVVETIVTAMNVPRVNNATECVLMTRTSSAMTCSKCSAYAALLSSIVHAFPALVY